MVTTDTAGTPDDHHGHRERDHVGTGPVKREALELPGVRLHCEVSGVGPSLVLVHGSAVDGRTWDGIVPELAHDHRVIVYDRRGYGRSAHTPVRDHRVHARDLVAVLERVAAEPAVVVGWSSGGNVALAVATRRPDLVRSLVVVEAPFLGQRFMDRSVLRTLVRLKTQQLRGEPVKALEEFLRFGSAYRTGGNAYDRLDDRHREELRAYPGPVLAEWDPHPFGVMHEHISTRSVARTTMPLLWILGGEGSPWIAKLHDRVVRRRPDIRTGVIPGAGHLVHLEQPAEFVAAVRDWAGTGTTPQP
jgi:pimeloyl-ACP methyl ester carboxylesterase